MGRIIANGKPLKPPIINTYNPPPNGHSQSECPIFLRI